MIKHSKHIQVVTTVLFFLAFICNDITAVGSEKTETVYYYIVQPGDTLWDISKELYGAGREWERLYHDNRHIFDATLIYPDMKLEIPAYVFPENTDNRFMTDSRKKTNEQWQPEEYLHFNNESPERYEDCPKKTEEEALTALKKDNMENWLSKLIKPTVLTEKEKEDYRKNDSEAILYSYETEQGLPEDIWYALTNGDGTKWLIIENLERGKSQNFYCFAINSATGEIMRPEKIHGAGGELYLTQEDGILIWITTKEVNGKIIGIAGDYRGMTYIGGNFYYEKREYSALKECYQTYISSGNETNQWDVTLEYPY